MIVKKICLYLILFAMFIGLQMIVAPPVMAQSELFINTNSNTIFKPPKDGTPDDTAGAGSRNGGRCAEDELVEGLSGFKVLIPSYSQSISERPVFSVYIPKTVAKKIFFSLRDANESYYYQTILSVPISPGEFTFELPEDAPRMESNKEYTWFLGLVCEQNFDPNDPMLQGVIRVMERK
ncbi:DUF928 domain-containing protein [Argonema galeatum]|uniref:DUF928 domain-containing protein n=1 Tax=Argonema galeatum TaxID=2942762 RepID=UPI0020135053|nr:DUF928 domain-containing protein [Argonema galeatum]MCL1467311.1 DUF928 domain-containing protein [Argonema galeatum A003/A1]